MPPRGSGSINDRIFIPQQTTTQHRRQLRSRRWLTDFGARGFGAGSSFGNSTPTNPASTTKWVRDAAALPDHYGRTELKARHFVMSRFWSVTRRGRGCVAYHCRSAACATVVARGPPVRVSVPVEPSDAASFRHRAYTRQYHPGKLRQSWEMPRVRHSPPLLDQGCIAWRHGKAAPNVATANRGEAGPYHH